MKCVDGLYHRTTYQTRTLFCGFIAISTHILTHNGFSSGHPLRQWCPWLNETAIVVIIIIVTKLSFFIIVIIIFIIIIIFMMCRFNEYAWFTWSSCHAGVVRFLLDGCYGRWFVYVKQRTASRWPLRAGGTCILLRTIFVDMNTGRHWVLIVDQSDQGNILMQWPEPVR